MSQEQLMKYLKELSAYLHENENEDLHPWYLWLSALDAAIEYTEETTQDGDWF